MELQIENENTVSSYNDYVIMEPDDMSAALDQYWSRRKASRLAAVERLQLLVSDAEAESVWQTHCRRNLGFLTRLLKAGGDAFERALVSQLQWNRALARDARSLFLKEARVEIRMPLGPNLLRVVRAPGVQTPYDTLESPEYAGFEAGRAIVATSWKSQDLALILPSLEFIELDTFVLTRDQANWSTADAVPAAFAEVLPQFKEQLEATERAFARLRRAWQARQELNQAKRQLEEIDRAAAAWRRIHIPEHQKLELLRRFALFEDGDPAAPRGLLLIGPPGNGKTSIARALAATLDCHFQILSLPDFKMPSLGESAQKVRGRWDEARQHQPSIMFVDDCEGVLRQRGGIHADKISDEIVESFLPEWDGLRERSRILLIGATNRSDLLDGAVISRFGWVMEIQLPNAENRREILVQELRAVGINANPPENIAELTQGMSGRDLSNLTLSLRADCESDQPTEEEFSRAITAFRKLGRTKTDDHLGWETLILEHSSLERLQVVCALLKNADDWRAHGVSVPRSLLLIGAAGVGKRRAAMTLAHESGLNFLAPTMAQLKAMILGGSANAVRQMFERGRSMAPVIIFLDNLDKLTPKQSPFDSKDRLAEEIASQLQQEMSEATAADIPVFLIGATQDVDQVDGDVLNCFDERIELPYADAQSRPRLLAMLLAGKKLGFPSEEGSVVLSNRLDGEHISAGDLARWVQAAEQRALARAMRSGGPEHLRIELGDFEVLPKPGT